MGEVGVEFLGIKWYDVGKTDVWEAQARGEVPEKIRPSHGIVALQCRMRHRAI